MYPRRGAPRSASTTCVLPGPPMIATRCASSPMPMAASASQSHRWRCNRDILASSHEGLDAGLGAAEHQRVDVVRALVGVDGLEIAQHAHDMKLFGDAVAAV